MIVLGYREVRKMKKSEGVFKSEFLSFLKVRVKEMKEERDAKETTERRRLYLTGRVDGFESIADLWCGGEKI